MTPTKYDNPRRTVAVLDSQALLPSAFWRFPGDEASQVPPKLRPGAAITFAIAAVVIVLSLIEVLFS